MEDKRIEQVSNIMYRMHKYKLSAKNELNIQNNEFAIMKLLAAKKEEQMTISDISSRMQVSRPAISQVINALEDKDYVKRVHTKKDRRLVYVVLTKNGFDAVDLMNKRRNEKIKLLFDKLGDEDTDTFLRLFEKISHIITEI